MKNAELFDLELKQVQLCSIEQFWLLKWSLIWIIGIILLPVAFSILANSKTTW